MDPREADRAHFLAALLEGVEESVIATDLEGRIVYWNGGATRIFGYEAEELLGRSVAALHGPDEPGRLESELGRVLGGGTEAHAWRGRRKDGTTIWVDVRTTPRRDPAGTVVGFLGVCRDATERRRVEEALRRQEARFRLLIERTPDAVLVHRYGPLVYANPAALEVLGYPEAELLGRSIWEVIHPDDHARVAERATRLAATGVANPQDELRLLRRDGTPVTIEFSALPVEFDAQPAIVCVARDVSLQREMQARLMLADRMASVGTLAAGVAHELNNPLAFVISNLSFALEELREGRTGGAIEALVDATEGAHRVRAIVHELKAFSRPEAEVVQPIDVGELVRSSLAMTLTETRHRARVVTSLGATPRVLGNASRLGQVLVNLLVNAAQAIPEGAVDRHEIRVATRTDAAGRAVVEVSDTGSGIPRALLGRIFDPFFTTKPIGVGTGLGLSICHRIVTSLGGHLDVESEEGAGATFRVTLPASTAPTAPPPPRHAPVPEGPGTVRRGRILAVDDEALVGVVLSRLLGKSHDVVTVTSAKAALERLDRGERFDVVLCDLMMPGMSGMALHAELRARLPEVASRMVFLTGGAFTPAAHRFLDEVPNLRFEKPFDAMELRAAVDRLVDATAAAR